MKKIKKDYNINYIYKNNNEGKNFDKVLKELFKKFLINYKNKNETH